MTILMCSKTNPTELLNIKMTSGKIMSESQWMAKTDVLYRLAIELKKKENNISSLPA